MTDILMPKATAVWLVDNTSLSFEQIADFCGLHPLEVRGIADGDVARDIRGADPIVNGQLTREELEKAQANPDYRMKAVVSRHAELLKPSKSGPKYTPVSMVDLVVPSSLAIWASVTSGWLRTNQAMASGRS